MHSKLQTFQFVDSNFIIVCIGQCCASLAFTYSTQHLACQCSAVLCSAVQCRWDAMKAVHKYAYYSMHAYANSQCTLYGRRAKCITMQCISPTFVVQCCSTKQL